MRESALIVRETTLMGIEHASSREHLAWAYQVIAKQGLDDHTYTHLSCRAEEGAYYLAPFGKRFDEVVEEDLLTVQIGTHKIVSGVEPIVNKTAYYLHSPIYEARPDVGAILHLHTPEMIAVSLDPQGLRPLSQWALHFFDNVGYYDYDSLLLTKKQSQGIQSQLEGVSVIFMKHHGVIILGQTVWEAMFYLHHLQKACQTQCLIMAQTSEPLEIPAKVAKKACKDLLSFEKDLGWRDWCAWVRALGVKKESQPPQRAQFCTYSKAPYRAKAWESL